MKPWAWINKYIWNKIWDVIIYPCPNLKTNGATKEAGWACRTSPAWLLNTETKWPTFRRWHFECISLNENLRILNKISLKYVPCGLINNMATLVQIMAWHRTGDRHYLKPYWYVVMTHICVIRPQWVSTLRPRQRSHHFSDDIFKYIYIQYAINGSYNDLVPIGWQVIIWTIDGLVYWR